MALALDYSVVLRSQRGERTVPLDGFFEGPFQTGMAPDELLIKIVRGPLPAGAAGAYRKLAQPASGYSIVGVAAVLAMDGGIVSHARVALTGVGSNPYRAKAVEAALLGSDGSAGGGRGGRRARHGRPDRERRHPCRQRVPVGHGRRLHPSRDRGRAGALARDERQPASRVQVLRVTPGRRAPARLAGAILARDVRIGAARWVKGRRLSADDLVALAGAEPGEPFSVIVIEPGELHEDDAALRLAAAVAGPNLIQRGPSQSRVDLLAEAAGVLNVRIADLERLNRIDPLEVFTAFDGQVVARGDLVASVKVAPHVVDAARVDEGARVAGFGSHPLVWVAPFIPSRVGVIVKESVRSSARERFEASVHAKVEGLGSTIESIEYVDDDPEAVEAAMAGFVRRPDPLELILTAGAASTDPLDACFVAITALGGRIVRRGVPAHPGSMLWLARIGGTAILGLPTCGAYSKATAADLLLPRLLSGEGPTEKTVAKLGHGGILTRSQRFRFPAYARELDAPDG